MIQIKIGIRFWPASALTASNGKRHSDAERRRKPPTFL
jgi:hypothetical protein